MSALTVLFLVLPLPIAFIIHSAEEVIVMRKWLKKHGEALESKFPRAKRLIAHLSQLPTRFYVLTATEEMGWILVATAYVLVGAPHANLLWTAVFMAFAIHLTIHIVKAIAMRSYIPGLATAVLLLPYVGFGFHSVWHAFSALEIIGCSIVGLIAMVSNKVVIHWLAGRR